MMRLQISRDLGGVLCGFAACGAGWWAWMNPAGRFRGKIHLFASFAHRKEKKPFEEISLRGCRKHLSVTFSLCPAASSPASATPVMLFLPLFPSDAKIRGAVGIWGPKTVRPWGPKTVKSGFDGGWCGDPILLLILSWLFD